MENEPDTSPSMEAETTTPTFEERREGLEIELPELIQKWQIGFAPMPYIKQDGTTGAQNHLIDLLAKKESNGGQQSEGGSVHEGVQGTDGEA